MDNERIKKVFARLKRVCDRGTCCHLAAEMIRELSATVVTEWWIDKPQYDDSSGKECVNHFETATPTHGN